MAHGTKIASLTNDQCRGQDRQEEIMTDILIKLTAKKLAIILISIVILVITWAFSSAQIDNRKTIKIDIEAVENVARVEA